MPTADMKLLLKDYKKILDFCQIKYANLSAAQIKTLAEHTLANKLCRCLNPMAQKINLKLNLNLKSKPKPKHMRFSLSKKQGLLRKTKKRGV